MMQRVTAPQCAPALLQSVLQSEGEEELVALLGTGSVYERWIKCGTDGTEGVTLEEVRAAGGHRKGFVSTGGGELVVGLLTVSKSGTWAETESSS